MSETTQEERDCVRRLANQVITDDLPVCRYLAHRLTVDADRLAEAEELLRIASSVCDPVASKLAQRINAFLSGGGASND